MPDGLYRLVTAYFCAGFVVEGGHITRCAPIIRANMARWVRLAKKIGD